MSKENRKPEWCNRIAVLLPCFTLCTTVKQFNRVQRHLGIKKEDRAKFLSPECDGCMHTLHNKKGAITCVVCIDTSEATDAEIVGLIAHESMYVWQAFLRDIGEYSPSAEFEAYAVQHIVQELYVLYLRGKS